jgi:hypothetical protein
LLEKSEFAVFRLGDRETFVAETQEFIDESSPELLFVPVRQRAS